MNEQDWRTIHNALAVHQCSFRQTADRQRIQILMDKIRDHYISPLSTFAVGDRVKISPESEYTYEVAELKEFPHGIMVGIYDEPPSEHIDYWKPTSLTKV